MTAAQFRKVRERLWPSTYKAANALGVSQGAIIHWQEGRRPVPKIVVKLLECIEAQKENGISD